MVTPAYRCHEWLSLFYAYSGEQKDLSLAEVLRRLLNLAREVGIIKENTVLVLVDVVMPYAVVMLQSGKRWQLVNIHFAAS